MCHSWGTTPGLPAPEGPGAPRRRGILESRAAPHGLWAPVSSPVTRSQCELRALGKRTGLSLRESERLQSPPCDPLCRAPAKGCVQGQPKSQPHSEQGLCGSDWAEWRGRCGDPDPLQDPRRVSHSSYVGEPGLAPEASLCQQGREPGEASAGRPELCGACLLRADRVPHPTGRLPSGSSS